ncbi:2,4-dihydroxyhept-2-ene-1,7-dioic acid aldolase [hydrothermal vent metagenome]|uniref:2,4-dihydroxyhept-2-ene-1,7-dioic acid aldolase n=1 Tax=hydrothermal vent metagenome TaxID=652676 RepID=A0A3B0Y3G6_9ZZZZ
MLKLKLNTNSLTIGSWITLGHTAIAEIMAKAEFDWLVVDLEHSVINIDVAGELIRTIDLCGIAPLVRLTSNDQNQIKRVMDAGAHGIVVPMVNTAAEATKAVSATRYAPAGVRGVGLARAQGYGVRFKEYLKWQVNDPVVIVQIEHKDAIANLVDILEVAGVDGFIIGPYDLSCSMGIPGEFEHPEFVAAVNEIRNIGRELNCSAGIHIVEPDTERLEQSIKDGYKFIAYSVDIRMLDVAAREGTSVLRKLIESEKV